MCKDGRFCASRIHKQGESRIMKFPKYLHNFYKKHQYFVYISEKECEAEAKNEELCIFGVPLDVAVERQRCHDGIPLPMVVRLCVDYVEDQGLMLEGIYRSSGVKSKVNKLRAAFNSRTCSGIALSDYEPAVVASVLKQVSEEHTVTQI